ncbi:MAG: hypothetical protein Q8J66_09365 [Methylotenera sp.]|nr:hypothetical protein [Methylotenera sp.]
MKRIFVTIALSIVFNTANAAVITLKCEGPNSKGLPSSVLVNFSPDQGWAKLELVDIKMTSSVTANEINVFLLGMKINRATGEYTQKFEDSYVKGMCTKNVTKF